MLKDISSAKRAPAELGLPPDREAEATLMVPGNWTPGVEPHIPSEVADVDLEVFVNHGRWLVQCPCNSAQLASRTDKRFFCVECGNIAADGKWVRVTWPADAKDIEEELELRPYHKNRNWHPGETLTDLRAEARERVERLS